MIYLIFIKKVEGAFKGSKWDQFLEDLKAESGVYNFLKEFTEILLLKCMHSVIFTVVFWFLDSWHCVVMVEKLNNCVYLCTHKVRKPFF